jgi:hypothetical protein
VQVLRLILDDGSAAAWEGGRSRREGEEVRSTLISIARRRVVPAGPPGRELTEAERQQLPPGFEAVGEALVSGDDPRPACAAVGRSLACDGAPLGEALAGLRTTCTVLRVATPDFSATEALGLAWSEATLEFLHELSCEDPLTGLASLAHLRTRLTELYREAERDGLPIRESHALVVVDVARRHTGSSSTAEELAGPLDRALTLATVAHAVGTVFLGGETAGQVAPGRVVVLARRTPALGGAVAALRETCADLAVEGVRVWVKGLPTGLDSALRLLADPTR